MAVLPRDSAPRAATGGRLAIYLVASEDQAQVMRESLAHLADTGDVPLNVMVLVAGTPEQAAAAQQAVRDEQQFRHEQGLPGVMIVDTRPASADGEGPK